MTDIGAFPAEVTPGAEGNSTGLEEAGGCHGVTHACQRFESLNEFCSLRNAPIGPVDRRAFTIQPFGSQSNHKGFAGASLSRSPGRGVAALVAGWSGPRSSGSLRDLRARTGAGDTRGLPRTSPVRVPSLVVPSLPPWPSMRLFAETVGSAADLGALYTSLAEPELDTPERRDPMNLDRFVDGG
jgi:hypothetical protein